MLYFYLSFIFYRLNGLNGYKHRQGKGFVFTHIYPFNPFRPFSGVPRGQYGK